MFVFRIQYPVLFSLEMMGYDTIALLGADHYDYACLQVEDEKMQGLYVMKLVRSFCRSPDENQGIFN